MIDIILSDLDSSLADTRGRAHLASKDATLGHMGWVEYSKACVTDAPIAGAIATLQLLASSGYPIFLVSGRNIEAEAETRQWLDANNVPFDRLRLRRREDIQHNGEYKVAYVRELRREGLNPVLMLEDHIGVSEMVEAEGVPVLTVNPRYDDPVGINFNNLRDRKPFEFHLDAPSSAPLAITAPRHQRARR